MSKYWQGSTRSTDDFGRPITTEFVDGKTVMGPWASMAPESFRIFGVGLGNGRGQRYVKQADGRWLKVEG
jgi:hypothetical protein